MSSWSLFAKPKPTPAIGPWVRSLDDEKYWQLFQEVEAKDKGTLLKEAQKRDVPAWIQETVEYGIEQQAARERRARNLALQKLGGLSPETIERRAAEERGRGYLKDDDYLDTSLRSGSGGSGLFGSKRPVSARRKAREAQLRSARKSAEGRSKVADKLRAAEAADFIPYGRAWAAVDDDDERNADEIVGNNGDDNKFRVLAIAGVSSDGNHAGVRVGRSTRTDESIVQAEKDRRNAAKALAKVPAHLHDVDPLSDEDEAVAREARDAVKEKVAKTFGIGGPPHGRGPLAADEDVTTTGRSAAPAPSAAAMKKTASALTSSLSRPYGWRRAIADFFHLTSKPDGEWNEAEHVKNLRRSKMKDRGHHLNRADDLHHVTERNDAPVVQKLLLEKTLCGEMSVQAFDRAQQNQSREGLLHSVLDRFDESEFFHIHSVLQRKKEADASRLGRGGGSPPRSAANADYVRQLAGIPPDVLRLIDKRRQQQAQREEDERNWGNPVWVQRENLANRIIDSVAYEAYASSTDLEVLEMGDLGGSSTSVVDATNTSAVDAKTRGSRLSLVSSRSSAAGQDADESRSILSASTATLQRHGVDVSKTIAEKPAQEPQRGDFLSDDNLRRLDLQTGRAARKPSEGAGESHEEDGRGGGGAICSVDLNTEEEDDDASLLAQDGLDVVRNGVFKGGPAAARYAERTRPRTAQDERDEHDAHLLWRNPRAAPRGPKADEKQQLEVLTAQKKNSSLWMRFGYQKQQAQRKPNKRDMQVIDELKSEVQDRPKRIGLVSPADADIVNGTATERRRAAMLKVEDVADADNSPDWSTRRGYYKESTRGKNAPHLLYAPLASRSAIIIRNTLFNFGEGEAAAEKRGVGGSPAASAASNEGRKTSNMNTDKELFEALSPRQQFRQTKPPSEAILMHHVAPRVAGPPPALSAGTIISSGLTLADLEHRFPDAVHCSGFLPVAGGAAVSGEKSDTLQSQWTMNRSRATRSKEERLRDLADENYATTSETDEAASSKAVAIGNGLAPLIRLISSSPGSCEGTHNAATTPRNRSSSPGPGKTILERTASPRRKLGDIEGRLIRFEICQVQALHDETTAVQRASPTQRRVQEDVHRSKLRTQFLHDAVSARMREHQAYGDPLSAADIRARIKKELGDERLQPRNSNIVLQQVGKAVTTTDTGGGTGDVRACTTTVVGVNNEKDEEQEKLLDILAGYGLTERQGKIVRNPFRGGRKPILPKRDFVREDVRKNHLPVDTVSALLNACDASAHGALLREYRHCESAPAGGAAAAVAESPFSWTLNIVPRKPISMGARLALEKQSSPGRGNGNHKHNMMIQEHQVQDCEREPPSAVTAPARSVMSIFFTATRLTLYLDHVPLVVFGFTHKDRDYQDVLTSSDPRTPNMRKLVTEVWPLRRAEACHSVRKEISSPAPSVFSETDSEEEESRMRYVARRARSTFLWRHAWRILVSGILLTIATWNLAVLPLVQKHKEDYWNPDDKRIFFSPLFGFGALVAFLVWVLLCWPMPWTASPEERARTTKARRNIFDLGEDDLTLAMRRAHHVSGSRAAAGGRSSSAPSLRAWA
eukprot:g1382.t1